MRSQHFSRNVIALFVLFVPAAIFFFGSSANATIMQRLEIEELARNSTDVFYGQIPSTQVYWNAEHTRIYTGVNVRISRIDSDRPSGIDLTNEVGRDC